MDAVERYNAIETASKHTTYLNMVPDVRWNVAGRHTKGVIDEPTIPRHSLPGRLCPRRGVERVRPVGHPQPRPQVKGPLPDDGAVHHRLDTGHFRDGSKPDYQELRRQPGA